ncbi:MAG: TlpA disulfide reductase family protein [Puia sp.]
MARYLFLLLFFSLVKFSACAQPADSSFTLEGQMNTDSGTVELMQTRRDAYYPFRLASSKAPLVKGRFIFRGSVLYPSAFRVRLFKGNEVLYMSGSFLVDPGFQTISCNVDSLRERPLLINNSMLESKRYFGEVLGPVMQKIGQLEEERNHLRSIYKKNIPDSLLVSYKNEENALQLEKKRTLLNYTKKHPSSYVALWELIGQFEWEYEPIWDTVYARFSDSIKNTHTGKTLAARLYGARVTLPGSTFPGLPLLTVTNKPVSIPDTATHNQYTLIDFWYSHCGPCISQFQDLKNIYAVYRPKGFDILGISVDKKDLIKDWKAAIKQYRLPWKQYLDLEGKEAHKLSITFTPTNFLLDDRGKVIARDMQPAELKLFLEKHLH